MGRAELLHTCHSLRLVQGLCNAGSFLALSVTALGPRSLLPHLNAIHLLIARLGMAL